MNYNELSYYHANPFYKQDYIPNRAWYNRQAKAFPSQLPSGKDFFTDNGRKHFQNRFNHSQIQQDSILKSPQKYPFQNRIAMDKTYMRSLQTIDIEGASSNTRINQSVKNKYKARDDLARRYNQSLEKNEQTQEQKRREAALKRYVSVSSSRISGQQPGKDSRTITNNSNNPEGGYSPYIKRELSDEYKRYIMQNSSNKFHKDIPVADYPSHLRVDQYSESSINYNTNDPSTNKDYSSDSRERAQHKSNQIQAQQSTRIANNNDARYQGGEVKRQMSQREKQETNHISYYQNEFNADKLRKSEQYQKILKYQEINRRMLQNPKDIRKNNPTNLSVSFNLAGQSIVSS